MGKWNTCGILDYTRSVIMSRLYRTLSSTKKAAVGGDVVITVKEYFLDPENAFADTFVKNLEGITVKLGEDIETTNASGVATFSDVEDSTYTMQVYKMDVQLTTHKEELVVSEGAIKTIKLYECLYTPNEVNSLIDPDDWAAGTYPANSRVVHSGTVYVANTETSEEPPHADWDEDGFYIPVATPDEFDGLRTTSSAKMGENSIWEDIYAKGNNKSYIQVNHLDFNSYGDFEPLYSGTTTFKTSYRGNELIIKDITLAGGTHNKAIFGYVENATFLDIIIYNAYQDIITSTQAYSIFIAKTVGNTTIDNCHIKNSQLKINNLSGTSASQISLGIAWLIGDDVVITNSTIQGKIESELRVSRVGGFIGLSIGTLNSLLIENCHTDMEIIIFPYRAREMGGFVGYQQCDVGEIKNCSSILISNTEGSVTSGQRDAIGGFVGYGSGTYENCHTDVDMFHYCDGGSGNVGGFIGSPENFSTNILKCYSKGKVEVGGNGVYAGGFMGTMRYTSAFPTINDCYSHCDVIGINLLGGFTFSMGGGIANNCYSTGQVTGTGDLIHGFCTATSDGVTTNCYWDMDSSGRATSARGEGRTTAQMKEGAPNHYILPSGGTDIGQNTDNKMYTDWSYGIWNFGKSSEYPKLAPQLEPQPQKLITLVKTDNTGTSTDNEFTIPTVGVGYDYKVERCDSEGNVLQILENQTGSVTLQWTEPGVYYVMITPQSDGSGFPRI